MTEYGWSRDNYGFDTGNAIENFIMLILISVKDISYYLKKSIENRGNSDYICRKDNTNGNNGNTNYSNDNDTES